MIKDQLSWEEFLKNSPKNKKINKVEPFNRLIAHSKNLFVISGVTGEAIMDVAKHAFPFVFSMICVAVALAYIPFLSLVFIQ